MIEKTGPTIYKGESIYNTGAGGGNNGIKILTDFSNYDTQDNTDYPIIGYANKPFDPVYTTQKKDYGLDIVGPNSNAAATTSPFLFSDYSQMILNIGLSLPTQERSFIWFSGYGISRKLDGVFSLLTYNYLDFDNNINFITNVGSTIKEYEILSNSGYNKALVFKELLKDDGYVYLYGNEKYLGKFLKSKVQTTYNYVNLSPRYSGVINLFSLFVK